jgi:hypothetical protein
VASTPRARPASTITLAALAVAGLASTRVTTPWANLVDSRVGQSVIAALELPRVDEDTDDGDDRPPE